MSEDDTEDTVMGFLMGDSNEMDRFSDGENVYVRYDDSSLVIDGRDIDVTQWAFVSEKRAQDFFRKHTSDEGLRDSESARRAFAELMLHNDTKHDRFFYETREGRHYSGKLEQL